LEGCSVPPFHGEDDHASRSAHGNGRDNLLYQTLPVESPSHSRTLGRNVLAAFVVELPC
jgi:hypothetical protein